METPKIDLHKCSQLLSDKGKKVIQWDKDNLSTIGASITGYPHTKNESK